MCPKCGGKSISWTYVVDLTKPGEGRKQRKGGGFETKRAAEEAMARLQVDVADGNHVEPRKLTLGAYLDRWLATTGPVKGWTVNGTEGHRYAIEGYIKPRLGSVLLQSLTRDDIMAFYGWCLTHGRRSRKKGDATLSGLSRKSVQNIHITLRAALSDALSAEPPLINRNPALKAYRYSFDKERPEMLTWTVDEMHTFLASVSAERDYPLYVLLLNTGVRRGEALGLRRQDIHLNAPTPSIEIRQQWAKSGHDGATFRSLKDKAGHWRTIDLDPETADVLRTHLQAQAFERRRDDYEDRGLVFAHPDGTPYDPDVTSRQFVARVKACGQVKTIRFHDLRHTHATLLLEAGEAMDYVADRLGDRLDTVAKVYAHVTRRRRDSAVARWAALKAAATAPVAEVSRIL